MQELNNEKEAAVNLTLSKVEEQKLLAAKEARRLAEISFQEKLKVKMREAREAWQHEMDVSSKICKEESNLSVSNAIKDEKQKVEKLRKSIDSVHLKYREEIESLKNVIKVQQRDLEKAILQKVEEERCSLQQNFEIEAEKVHHLYSLSPKCDLFFLLMNMSIVPDHFHTGEAEFRSQRGGNEKCRGSKI